MTAPTMTKIGELRTAGRGYYDAGEQNASVQTYSIDGLSIRLDADGRTVSLYPGEGYELRPNDGWYVERQGVHYNGAGHWAHLVDADGAAAKSLPLVDGTVILDRAKRYLIRQDGWHSAWNVYEA